VSAEPRNARQEAFARLDGLYETRVLEPSPPADESKMWFADDPTERGEVPAGRQVVSPVTSGDVLWHDLARDDPELAGWCAERWLGAWRPLGPAPVNLAGTRLALHRVAEHLMKPVREHANGKFGLRFTRGGFGTPFFGDDAQLRVEGTELVVQEGAEARGAPITTLAAGADLVGDELMPPGLNCSDEPLVVDEEAARFLADWYGFAASVLEQLRAEAGPELEGSRVQLWPEHFDIATELGAEDAGQRAGYGFSPSDEEHPEPYAYVVPWGDTPAGELWNAQGLSGAELSYAELLAADDQRANALEFMRARRDALTA
jgi:hypothetical protein